MEKYVFVCVQIHAQTHAHVRTHLHILQRAIFVSVFPWDSPAWLA